MTTLTSLPIANFLSVDRTPRLDSAGSPANALDGVRGQFALHQVGRDGTHLLARDPLGVNKLFFSTAAGVVRVSNYWIDLLKPEGTTTAPPAPVWSVPSGHVISLHPGRRTISVDRYAALRFTDTDHARASIAADIRNALDRTFRRIRTLAEGRPLYVTLSGGLDSTGIAALAREHLGAFTAVTFAIDDGKATTATDDDLSHARRVATEFGVPMELVVVRGDDLLDLIDLVLTFGQDWRDFNVHCGVVSAAIGRALARRLPSAGPRPILLTGDTMNELMADYATVMLDGEAYYRVPDIPAGQLRRFFVQGLDAGDREVGIFHRFGLDVIQPYAWCADAYAAVPATWIESRDAKSSLARAVLGSQVPGHVYDRKKVRAQLGSESGHGGVLRLFVDHGLDSAWLQRRFATLFDLDPAELSGWIKGGVYRVPTTDRVFGRSAAQG